MEQKNKLKFSKSFYIVLIIILFIFIAGVSYLLGYKNQLKNYFDNNNLYQEAGLNGDFSLFWQTVRLVKEKHIYKDKISDQELIYGAIQGVLNALDDPYTTFFNPEDAKKFQEDISGNFGGIGAEISMRKNQLIIVAPLKNSPAERAGLKPGDKILKVNDKETFGLSIEEAVKIIRGEPNTEVTLLIMRDDWDKAKEFKIKREIIQIPTLDWEIKDDILYVKLYNFNYNTEKLLYEAVMDGYLKNVKGMILDLRNNPGGFLDVAVRVGGWFLKRGEVVVKERFYNGEEKSLMANGNSALSKLPLVVLINNGSASASEILAGALRENRGVKLIGEKTFGKGSVQQVEILKDGSIVKISVAEWLTPKGNIIEKKGLEPDIEIKMEEISEEDIKKGKDPQFEKAFELIKSLID